jgi:chemotaxis protein CheD
MSARAFRELEDEAAPPAEGDAATVYLNPGQVFASADDCTISTILGSCVAVCLFDPVRRVGGANHYLLPLHAPRENASARYGNVAIDQLVARLGALGCRPQDLVAKLFGGASLLRIETRAPRETLGAQNVQVARGALAALRIPVAVEDVGGERGRKLLFRPRHGDAWVRKL